MSDWWTGAPVVSPAPSPRSVARQPQARRQAAPIRFANDQDALARTLLGEAGNQDDVGMLAVGGTVVNRARARGLTPSQVVLEPNQFEPWGNPQTTQRLLSVSPNSPDYQRAYQIAGRALAGEDPTGGADHFYAPKAQAALGRPAPSWAANATPTVIGDHNFYNLSGGSSGGGGAQPNDMADMPSQSGSDWWSSAPVVDPAAAAPEAAQKPAWDGPTTDIKDGVWVQGTGGESDWQYMSRERANRLEDPEYQRAFADAQRGSENVPDQLRALGLGASYGFLTDINAEAQRVIQGAENIGRRATGQEVRYGADDLAQATRDAMRDDQAAYAAAKPLENFALQLAGGVVAPGAIQGGQFIGTGAGATGRAAAVGGAMGAASGIGYGQGNLIERAPDAAIGGLTGAGTGAIIQGGLNRLAAPGQGGGAARRLSRQGVDLTPGQMISETPVIGEFARNIEDVAGGFNPLMMGVRRGQNEQMVRAAGNEALGYIGETLPKDSRTGYQVSQAVKRVLGDKYDDVTSRITAQADQQVYTELADLTQRASQTLDESGLRRLDRILNDKFVNEFDASGQLSGDNFKRIERALREQSDRASRPTSTLADNDLAEFLDEARDIARGLIARQYPAEAETIQALNRGWATNKIIERAVTGSAGFSRSGTPTPGEISQAVVNSSNLGAIANENALLQGLATDARTVLPSTVPDSGTAQKTVLAAGVGALGAGGAAVLSPGLAPLIASGAVLYSRPGIIALNAVYRATDSRAANAALRQLADQARRNPSLLPYYEDAVQHALSLSQRDTQAAPPAPPSAQAPSPALQRVLQ